MQVGERLEDVTSYGHCVGGRQYMIQIHNNGRGYDRGEIMKYMLLIYGDEGCWTEDERKACMIESMGISQELETEGKLIAAAPLHSVTTATSVRVRNERRQVTDGPFAETTEQLGGYYIIDVENLDEAITIASRLPPAKKGTVEIRPLFPLPEVPNASAAVKSELGTSRR